MTSSEQSLTSGDFPVHWPVSTRWTDNDMFGHLNNAVYYALFDTAINGWINTNCVIDPLTVPWLGVVAESGCRYFAELRFPNRFSWVWRSLGWATAASRTGWGSGRRSQRPVAAVGHWVHVYVDRAGRRPVPIPEAIRSLLETARVD